MRRGTTRGLTAGLAAGLMLLTMIPPARALEYTVGPGDVLDITVLGEPDVSRSVMVSPEGVIVLPLIGEVQAAGLTLPQLTDKLTAAFKKFIRNPQVTAVVRQAGGHRQFAYLLGQVVRPGAFEVEKGWTIAQLVAAADGPAPGAALSNTLILRQNETIPVDLERLLVEGDASANVTLQPGDVVIVPETKDRVVIMGAVAKPGPYLIKPGDRVVDLLSVAGGPTPNAVIKEIGVIRQVGTKPSVTPIDLSKFYKEGTASQNILLQSGDVVYVPERSGVNWTTVLQTLSGLSFLLYVFH